MIGKDTTPDIGKDTQFKPGQSGNPAGKPKGSRHLSTIIQELAEDIDWDKTTLKNKEELKAKYGKNGFKAVAYVALTKAMTGDVQAMKWLAENGYGKHLDVTSGGDKLPTIIIESAYARKPNFRIDNEVAETDKLAENSNE
jgi:hypothetical protein